MKIGKILIITSFLLARLFIAPASAQETLSWQDCVREAQKNHPDLIVSQESINQEKAAKTITQSGLYPQIDGSLSASSAKTAAGDTAADSYSYGVTGAQLVFDGFKTVNDLQAASENIKAAQESYRFVSSEVRLRLRTAFVSLLRAQELERVADEIVKIRKDNLVLISLRYESGLEHKGALLAAEANLAAAKLELSQAGRDTEIARRQLTKEMGREIFAPVIAQGDFAVSDVAQIKPDFEKLAAGHPSLRQAAAKTRAASFSAKSAVADFFPHLSGSGSVGRTSSGRPPEDDHWSAALTLTMPIFEGGLRQAQVSKAKAALREAQASQRSTGDSVMVSLEEDWAALKEAVETVGVKHKLLEAAEERAKIAEAQYSIGFISFDNWIIIQNDLVSAKKSYLEAQADALFAEAGWIYAKGETLEYVDK